MKKLLSVIAVFFISLITVQAQETFPINGVKDSRSNMYAFTNAKIYIDAEKVIENATLLIKDNKVMNVGAGIAVPKEAIVVNCEGKTIYPSFIDMYTNYGMPELKRANNNNRNPQFLSNKKGAYHWNEAVKPEYNANEEFTVSDDKAKSLREMGFGMVMSLQKDGIARGTSVLVNTKTDKENLVVVKDKVSANYSFSKGNSTQDYPSSLMGSIALLRQTFYDAAWYEKNKKEYNLSYEALNNQKSMLKIFEVSDVHDIFRADKIAKEFSLSFVYKANGTEYQRLKELKNINANLIIGLSFPKVYDVEDYYDALNVNIAELKHWELAPYNAAYLEKEKIRFAITASDNKSASEFYGNLRKAVKAGLSERQALQSLTNVPAQMLGVADQVGSLKAGLKANFIITSGNILTDEEASILENWVEGTQYVINTTKPFDIRGKYDLKLSNGKSYELNIKGSKDKPELSLLKSDSSNVKLSYQWNADQISMVFNLSDSTAKGKIRLSGTILSNNNTIKMMGEGMAASTVITWSANFKSKIEEKKEENKKAEEAEKVAEIVYPFAAYGSTSLPKAEKWLIKNATVWTNESEGKIENADVLIVDGKIAKVGKSIAAGDAKQIDGTGKHVTAGIIDEHSHIAITRGVNEGTQAVTSEVRIGDALEPDDVNIYRQLAGGVTSSQLLHGSANPVGGQSALIKLRWGKMAEELKFEGADQFIKFALGENVKQSNWGDNNRVRFPQTRMGVEQVYIDAFTRAKEYEQSMKTPGFRRDLELDALLEIINKKRFITCHSYVQSEINMLMKVAEMFNFNVNTFTHILEGYKVADKMKMHNANASTFSDWWAYKYEVIDAIPYNAAIMTKVGVNTSINSDDAEMARRLNQEAAKAVKYGGVTEEEALKMVTLNPAKMLHVDDKVGSLKAGKSADLVIWTDHPLSIYAKPVKTFVDGIDYFDAERDLKLREEIRKERERLIQKSLDQKKIGMPTQKPAKAERKLYHCDEAENEMSY